MAILVSQISTSLGADKEKVISTALKRIFVSESKVISASVHKTSLDARKQERIKLVHSVYLELEPILEQYICGKFPFCSPIVEAPITFEFGKQKPNGRIAIAGFGPAGIFAALVLAENGYRPIVFEKGADINSRVDYVNSFWRDGKLDTQSNVQFGEGGAGTFSDGKLTTRVKDPLCRYVIQRFADFGAPKEILTKAKPHIGTDNLRSVIKSIREYIISKGGEIRFMSPISDIKTNGDRICSVVSNGEEINVETLILAVGHSARDTFELLHRKGIFMEAKAFSVGARIEHRQRDVNTSLYGNNADNPLLPEGEYQLSHKIGSRAVYTFCMCPGGIVVPSSSEKNGIVTNGMSEFARNSGISNSAIVVSVFA